MVTMIGSYRDRAYQLLPCFVIEIHSTVNLSWLNLVFCQCQITLSSGILFQEFTGSECDLIILSSLLIRKFLGIIKDVNFFECFLELTLEAVMYII